MQCKYAASLKFPFQADLDTHIKQSLQPASSSHYLKGAEWGAELLLHKYDMGYVYLGNCFLYI